MKTDFRVSVSNIMLALLMFAGSYRAHAATTNNCFGFPTQIPATCYYISTAVLPLPTTCITAQGKAQSFVSTVITNLQNNCTNAGGTFSYHFENYDCGLSTASSGIWNNSWAYVDPPVCSTGPSCQPVAGCAASYCAALVKLIANCN